MIRGLISAVLLVGAVIVGALSGLFILLLAAQTVGVL